MYKKEYVQTFLEKQGQLFDEPVAEDFEEAEEFLEDCMAVVLDSLKAGLPLKDALIDAGAVTDCTMESETVYDSIEKKDENAGYFTTIIVRDKE